MFAAYCASGAVSVLAGAPLTCAFGLRGVIGSMIAASLAGLAASYTLLYRRMKPAMVPDVQEILGGEVECAF